MEIEKKTLKTLSLKTVSIIWRLQTYLFIPPDSQKECFFHEKYFSIYLRKRNAYFSSK